MYVLKITEVYADFLNNTDSKNDNNDLIVSKFSLSIPSGVLFLFLFSFMIWTMIKPLLAQ